MVADTEVGQMKGIFKRISAGATGEAGKKTRKVAVRKRYIVRG